MAKENPEENWTTVRIKKTTLNRLQIAKARCNDLMYDETINRSLDLLEKTI